MGLQCVHTGSFCLRIISLGCTQSSLSSPEGTGLHRMHRFN